MSKRARFDGPAEAAPVHWPPGEVYPEKVWTVEKGHYLPDDAPAALRDELTAGPYWTEVDYTPPGKAKGDSKDGDK
jgi:hypothetical protein